MHANGQHSDIAAGKLTPGYEETQPHAFAELWLGGPEGRHPPLEAAVVLARRLQASWWLRADALSVAVDQRSKDYKEVQK